MLRYGAKYFLKNGKKCLHCVQEYYIIKIVKDDEHKEDLKNVNQRIFKEDNTDYENCYI